MRQIEALSKEIRDLREENRRTETLDKEIQDLQRENSDLREEKDELLREKVERKNRDIQEFRTEVELLKVTNKTVGPNFQNFSPSQVSLLAYIIHRYSQI
jgi:predicted  nucleic acid-binding Zn-ribbon protein